jgi:hypothetical protein
VNLAAIRNNHKVTALLNDYSEGEIRNRWSTFDVLDVRLYIGPFVDLRVLQGVNIIGGK